MSFNAELVAEHIVNWLDDYSEKSGVDSPDYLIMKFIHDKEGDCLLGQDGQQTFTILNLLVRPFYINRNL